MSDTTTTPTTFDVRDLEPPRRRASDLAADRDDISALAYGRLCALLSDAQRQFVRKAAVSRFDWARADGYAEGLAVACSAFSGIEPHVLRERLTPVENERRAR